MTQGVPIDIEQLRAALIDNGGLIALAARQMNVARQSVHRVINEHPELRDIIEDAREQLLDAAELALQTRVLANDWNAIKYTLDRLGRSRGYVPHTQLTGADGEPLDFDIPTMMRDALEAEKQRLADEALAAKTIDVTPDPDLSPEE